MERAKAERKVVRRLFTLCIQKLLTLIEHKEKKLIIAEFNKLTKLYEDLCSIQNKVLNLWLDDEGRDENLFDDDVIKSDEYDTQWYATEQMVKEFLLKENGTQRTNSTEGTIIRNVDGNLDQSRRFRLPKLELPKFDGDVKSWITFWSQFRKIDSDSNIDDDDKFQYLLQSMEYGSVARELVESYPPSGANYSKVLDQLKQRFARDEIIIEHYVRELLHLVLAQTKGTSKTPICTLYDKLMTQILALETLGVTQDKYAAFLLPLVESALPDEILKAWNRSQLYTDKEGSALNRLLNFVKLEVETEERIRLARTGFYVDAKTNPTPTTSCFATSSKNKSPSIARETSNIPDRVEKERSCVWCDKGSHSSSECKVAMKMNLEERKEFLKKNRICFICLKKNHTAKVCRAHPKCIMCGKRHYTLMCRDSPTSPKDTSVVSCRQTSIGQLETNKTVLLQTLKLKIFKGNESVQVRAIIDSGAQRTFIKKEVADKLKLEPNSQQSLSHSLFGGSVTNERRHKVYSINVSSIDGFYKCQMTAIEQPIICSNLPKLHQGSILDKLYSKGIFISDTIDDQCEISLLIGSDVLGSLLTGRSERVDENLLAIETKLGWTILGPAVDVHCSATGTVGNVATLHASCDLEAFWSLEMIGIREEAEVRGQKAKEKEVENFFKSTVRKDSDQRYEVRLPWNDKFKILLPNYDLAYKRLMSTSSRLTKLGILGEYNSVFQEWLDSSIIEKVENDNTMIGHYMPHHAVIREASSTTKIRPVFDASALDKNGVSLNSCLEKGSNLIEDIPRLLIQFRKYEIGITADIKKAFLQISLFEDDRDYLKFLWWRDINENPKIIQTFRHKRVVFGVTTSPYLLSATILHHLDSYDTETADQLRKSFYVDNCVVSVQSCEKMEYFIKEAKRIMLEGKFELRCWVTGPVITDDQVNNISVLGLMWDPRQDELYCKTQVPKDTEITKRYILSIAQSVYDPLGFLCPATIVPKLIIQKCWMLNLGWDQKLPDDLRKSFKDWLQQIKSLSMCRIPRRLSKFDLNMSNNSLHVFCDGSQSAYACCIFLRSEFEGDVSIQLIMAKARVAPTKAITIPRIELTAALIASRLANEVKNCLELNCKEYYWTDSTIVLAWLRKKTGFNVFVHNRVKEIIERTNVDDWRHISGDLNPADLPSRGCNPKALLETEWWLGPSWLKQPSHLWPHSVESIDEYKVEDLEVSHSLTVQSEDLFSQRLLYFSSYLKIIRMVGWCLRFKYNAKNLSKIIGDLTLSEVRIAEERVFKCIQREHFRDNVSKKLNLELFKDENDILRIKTRLSLSENSNEFNFPILLPKCTIVERLIESKHREYLHAGSQTLQTKLREQYWILGCRRLVNGVIKNCITCKRFHAKSCSAPIPPLPADRVNCGSPFEVTGVDFAGPLILRSSEKAWVALFTCAVYRAVHLELCCSLSTEAFMLALRRFLARRGTVRVIYSDNGTNFQGASNILKDLDWEKIKGVTKIEWRFSPPAAPWWGGFWERMVRTVKEILRRVLGKAALTFNEMATVLCEVEAIVNARPLTYITNSSENLQPLTPASFLLFPKTSNNDNLDVGLIDGHILTSRWRYVKKLCSDLKQRFRSEYLGLLLEKPALAKRHLTVKPGDIVLIEVNDRKRVEWPLGLVIELVDGADGHKRVARLKTATGMRLRSINSIYSLGLSCESILESNAHLPSETTECRSSVPTVTRSGRTVKRTNRLNI